MFMNSACWEGWKPYFEGKGYRVLAPNWPGRDAPVDALRRAHPDPDLGKLTLTDVVDFHADLVQKLDEPPVIVGHSMGALVAQILVNRGLGATGVAIDSAPPVGVFTPAWSFLKANFPMISPFVSPGQPHLMTLPQFQYAFVNSLPLAEQQAAYERYVVPESRRVPQESLLGKVARIDFKKPHAPLLLTAGSIDHIIPASLNRINYSRYAASPSPVEFKEFPGRTHFVIGQKDWEEVADYVLDWISKN